MLVLGRKTEQSIQIGDDIQVTILKARGNSVRLGIKAPDHVKILRGELESLERAWETDISFDSEQASAPLNSCK